MYNGPGKVMPLVNALDSWSSLIMLDMISLKCSLARCVEQSDRVCLRLDRRIRVG